MNAAHGSHLPAATGPGTAGKVNGRSTRHGQNDTNCFFHSVFLLIFGSFAIDYIALLATAGVGMAGQQCQ